MSPFSFFSFRLLCTAHHPSKPRRDANDGFFLVCRAWLAARFDPPKRVGRKFFTVHRGTGFCNRKCPLNLPGNPLISMHFGRLGSASTVCTTFFRSLALGFSVPEVKPFFASQLGSGTASVFLACRLAHSIRFDDGDWRKNFTCSSSVGRPSPFSLW